MVITGNMQDLSRKHRKQSQQQTIKAKAEAPEKPIRWSSVIIFTMSKPTVDPHHILTLW